MVEMTKTCPDCGKVFTTVSVRKIRCRECQTIRTDTMQKERAKERRWQAKIDEKLQVKPEISPTVCNKIKSCRYGNKAGSLEVCDYIEIVGHSRPCRAQNCTEYEPKKKRKKKVVGIKF